MLAPSRGMTSIGWTGVAAFVSLRACTKLRSGESSVRVCETGMLVTGQDEAASGCKGDSPSMCRRR